MIASLLIANRGEIACRIIRTARALGVRTIAVYSDADAHALHVREADEAVHIGPSPARESYLVGERIIAAAEASGAEAIHPGYGFLSENAEFAQSVLDAGLTWVGPNPASIRAMGLKDAAKQRMIAAGVPVTPGYLGEDQSPGRLADEAAAVGYPVLIKAVAGGGGKGMRRVDAAGDFADALLSCQREAAASFGNTQVLIEKYILSPRHIEVQVFGDAHGNVVHLFERDCSLQRRHQKVIEEAPAPGMDAVTRAAVCDAAVRAAKAVDYVGAGTIEFIADASEGLRADRIWFMEMNTRLQVEHPVTEQITGVDLVAWQLRVASGEPLPKGQEDLAITGWAIEARLYAEDPATGFLPSTGPLTQLTLPTDQVRVDTGVYQGGVVTPFYDPMIAKLIATGADRASAIARLKTACETTAIWPVKSNAAFLARCLADDRFRAGTMDTGLLAERLDTLVPPAEIPPAVLSAGARAVAAAATGTAPRQAGDRHATDRQATDRLDGTQPGGTQDAAASPWRSLFGLRLNAAPRRTVRIRVDGQAHDVAVDGNGNGNGNGDDPWLRSPPAAWIKTAGDTILSGIDDGRVFAVTPERTTGAAAGTAADGAILSPMPGRIIAVAVANGDTVAKGQKLLTLEAMKMEHTLTAPFDGTVQNLDAATGTQVAEGTLLANITQNHD